MNRRRITVASRKDGRYQLAWGGIVMRLSREEMVVLAADIAEWLRGGE
ncbi:hypothetical protein [Acidithiobacillus sp.]|nr:hypothetical protein [Acidithiobacillus sp.]MDD5375755.1 hypothetical protein [Acidithiobacillus sp.]